MSRHELRRILIRAIDIATHNAVQIPPADNHTHDQPTLVHAFDVVADPGYGVGDAGVNSYGGEEGRGVADVDAVGC